MNCRYCKREDDNAICLRCDGKHTARAIFKRMGIDKQYYISAGIKNIPDDENLKYKLMKRDILGIEGLTQDERQMFYEAFNREYKILCLQ